MMTTHVKRFIEQHIDLIENNQFTELYDAAVNYFQVYADIGELTHILESSGIHPLEHMNKIPRNYYDSSEESAFSIPNNIKQISEVAFCGSDIEKIIIPGNVSDIFSHAFDYCTSLTSVVCEEGVEFIGESCFEDCASLANVVLPKSLVAMEAFVFLRAKELTTIHYNGTVDDWEEVDLSEQTFNGSSIRKIICSDGEVTR